MKLSIILTGAVALAYINSFWGVFQFDDFNVIVYNPVVHSWQAWLSDVQAGGIRPFLKFYYYLNWVSGMGSQSFHLFNTGVHIINTILIYRLSLRLLPYHRKAAFIAALLFALHPVQTEAVTYISGSSTSLMAMFYLGSLLAYASRRWVLVYIASPLLFIMAVLTKEVALTLPLTLILWDCCCYKFSIKRQVVHWSLLFLILFLLLAHTGYNRFFNYAFGIRDLKENILSQINGVTYLMTRLILIFRLNIDPDLPVVSRWTGLLVAKGLFLSSLIFIGLISLRKRPVFGFCLLWFFLQLLPTNSVVPRLDIANERQLYLASWGTFLFIGIQAERLQRKHLFCVVIPLCLMLGLFTIARNHTYRSEIALWEDTIRKSPGKPRAYNNLGYAYFLSKRYEKAREAYLTALRLRPDYPLARNNLLALEDIKH